MQMFSIMFTHQDVLSHPNILIDCSGNKFHVCVNCIDKICKKENILTNTSYSFFTVIHIYGALILFQALFLGGG